MWSLPPRSVLPRFRHLSADQVWVVHKGQGRVVVEQEHATVLPGTVISIPKQAWFQLHNTGTGLLQGAWVSVPAGMERFFQALAARAADPGALPALAAQFDLEVQPAGESAAATSGGRGRHRRGRRGRASSARPTTVPQPAVPVLAPVPAAPAGAATPPGGGRRHRRRHRGRRGRGSTPPVAGAQPAAPAAAPTAAPHSPPPAQSPAQRSRGRERGRRFGRVKEVYMGGRWVRVQGEGPVISTGE